MTELINPQNLSLSPQQMSVLLPYLIMAIGAMVSLLAGVMKFGGDPETAVRARNLAASSVAIITIAAAIYSVARIWGEPSVALFSGMMAADYSSNLFNIVFLGATGLVLLSSWAYLEKEGIHHAEYYSLALMACLGMMMLASSMDLIVLFISLEIMSIAVYVLVGFRRTDVRSNEAAVKYFILGSAVSAILLYGIAMIYGATGSMNLSQIAGWIHTNPISPMFTLGAILMGVGLLFKVASVPFHMWMPDVYEGAPTTVTSFMTTGLKAAAFAAFLRIFIGMGYADDVINTLDTGFHNILWVVAVATMFLGNVIALTQRNIKRMLAYSSIAHTGYILVGILASAKSEYGTSSVVMYLISYVIMNLGAFAIVGLISERGDRNTDVESFAGIGFKHPLLGFAMTIFMFSMAGVPPTAGFAAKYMIFSSAIQGGEVWLTVLGVLCSAISAYYYLRVIVYMYMKEPVREVAFEFKLPTTIVILIAAVGTLQFGVFPSMLMHAAKKAAMTM